MDFPIFLQSGFQPNQKTDKGFIGTNGGKLEPKKLVVLIYTYGLNRLIKRELKSSLILYYYYIKSKLKCQKFYTDYYWSFQGFPKVNEN